MVKRKKNTQRANLTLGGLTLGFLCSYPFHASPIGGLIWSGCSAGMIGGFADWFAVTALFRRPFGIRPSRVIRTEIIPQNRERIYAALVDMVQNELLSQDVLRRKLAVWDFSGLLIRIFAEQDLRETLSQVLAGLSEELVYNSDPEEIKRLMQGLLQENCAQFNISQTIIEVFDFSVKHGDVDRVIKAICQAVYEFMDQAAVNTALSNMVVEALARYSEKNASRKLVEMFLPPPAVLAQGIQERAKKVLQDGTVQESLKNYIYRLMLELKTSPSQQELLNRFFLSALEAGLENKEFNEQIAAFLGTSSGKPNALIESLLFKVKSNWDVYLKNIEGNYSLRKKVDETVKGFLEKQIGYQHSAIGRMVRDGLEPLTNEMLVELIEDKAGNDLQMIRINGSLVGGFVGMLIYVLGMVLR